MIPKFQYLRSKPYRRYVASKACFGCGIEDWSQAAHPNQSKYGKGGRIKAGDQFCFPLCAPRYGLLGCHQQLDLCIDMTKDERDEMEDRYVERMQAMAIADGRPEFVKAA